MTDGFSPGSVVAASPTFSAFHGATERIGFAPCAPASSTTAPGSANGMIFTVAIMRPRLDRREFGKRRDGQAGIETVQRIDPRAVDDEQSGALGVEIAAAGAGLVEADILSAKRLGDAPCRFVLVDIARLKPRRDNLANTLFAKTRDERGVEPRALLDDARAMADRVRRDCALGLFKRNRSEFHRGSKRRSAPPAGRAEAPR